MGTYTEVSNGSNTVNLPVIAKGGYGYTTGLTILNTSGATVNGNISYYDLNGSLVGSSQVFNIGPNASKGIFQGSEGTLPANFYGTAVVTESGGSNDLIITTNALSPISFYSYTEPGQ